MRWVCKCFAEYDVSVEADDFGEAVAKAREELMGYDVLECFNEDSLVCYCIPEVGE